MFNVVNVKEFLETVAMRNFDAEVVYTDTFNGRTYNSVYIGFHNYFFVFKVTPKIITFTGGGIKHKKVLYTIKSLYDKFKTFDDLQEFLIDVVQDYNENISYIVGGLEKHILQDIYRTTCKFKTTGDI